MWPTPPLAPKIIILAWLQTKLVLQPAERGDVDRAQRAGLFEVEAWRHRRDVVRGNGDVFGIEPAFLREGVDTIANVESPDALADGDDRPCAIVADDAPLRAPLDPIRRSPPSRGV
jgi:hypothetical protein